MSAKRKSEDQGDRLTKSTKTLTPQPEHRITSNLDLKVAMDLANLLGLDEDSAEEKFKSMRATLRTLVPEYLDSCKKRKDQDDGNWKLFVDAACAREPDFMKYENAWPIDFYMTLYLQHRCWVMKSRVSETNPPQLHDVKSAAEGRRKGKGRNNDSSDESEYEDNTMDGDEEGDSPSPNPSSQPLQRLLRSRVVNVTATPSIFRCNATQCQPPSSSTDTLSINLGPSYYNDIPRQPPPPKAFPEVLAASIIHTYRLPLVNKTNEPITKVPNVAHSPNAKAAPCRLKAASLSPERSLPSSSSRATSLQVDEDEIPYLAEPSPAPAQLDLPVAHADEDPPANFANSVSLRDFLDPQPQLREFFELIGIKSDLDLLDLLQWEEGDRSDWFLQFVMGKRLYPYQLQDMQVEFQKIPFAVHPEHIDHQGFLQRTHDTGLSHFLSQIAGIKTEHDVKKVMNWDESIRNPFFHRFTLSRQISLFQLEVLRQVFKRLRM